MKITRTEYLYRKHPHVGLRIHWFEREDHRQKPPSPALLFFFGGGWMTGSPGQFFPQAAYFAARGYAVGCAEYRIGSVHGTTPFDSMEDAREALRWVREHCGELHVLPSALVAAGGSAGGHLALAAAMITREHRQSIPDALLLFNPVVDTSNEGFGSHLFAGRELEASPMERIKPGLPPMIVFHGAEDRTVPIGLATRFEQRMNACGNRCRLIAYPGQGHGFFNYRYHEPNPYYDETLRESEAFLQEHLEGGFK